MNKYSAACANCDHLPSQKRKEVSTFLGMVFLAILPKCPFCITAYTSTAILCAGNGAITTHTSTHFSVTSILFVFLFGLITFFSIAMNNRGARTKWSIAIAASGFLSTVISVSYAGGETLYYLGTLLFFVSAWLNGSLLWLIRTYLNKAGKPVIGIRHTKLFR